MTLYALFVTYEGASNPHKVADGCSKSRLITLLFRLLPLSDVAHFQIVPFDYYVPYKFYKL